MPEKKPAPSPAPTSAVVHDSNAQAATDGHAQPGGSLMTFDGTPVDAVRALLHIGCGLGLMLMAYGAFRFMESVGVVSLKGILLVILGPVVGGFECLVGV